MSTGRAYFFPPAFTAEKRGKERNLFCLFSLGCTVERRFFWENDGRFGWIEISGMIEICRSMGEKM